MKIVSLNNQSEFWAVLSLSKGEGNIQGKVDNGELAEHGVDTDVTNPFAIPGLGHSKRLFLMTSSGGYRIYSDNGEVYFETAEGKGDPVEGYSQNTVYIDSAGTPSLIQKKG